VPRPEPPGAVLRGTAAPGLGEGCTCPGLPSLDSSGAIPVDPGLAILAGIVDAGREPDDELWLGGVAPLFLREADPDGKTADPSTGADTWPRDFLAPVAVGFSLDIST
jgi:hypothetical protein